MSAAASPEQSLRGDAAVDVDAEAGGSSEEDLRQLSDKLLKGRLGRMQHLVDVGIAAFLPDGGKKYRLKLVSIRRELARRHPPLPSSSSQPLPPRDPNGRRDEPPVHFFVQDTPHILPVETNSIPQELPDYIQPIIEKHTSLWLKDVQRHTSRLTKLHSKHMSAFASDVFAAMKTHATHPRGSSSLPGASTSFASPPRASIPTVSPQINIEPPLVQQAIHNSDPSSSTHLPHEDQGMIATTIAPRRGDDIECPSFDILGEKTWSQHLAANNLPSPRGVANITITPPGHAHTGASHKDVETTTDAEPLNQKPQEVQTVHNQEPNADGGQSSSSDKKNRKKRAFLGRQTDAKKQKIKIYDEPKDIYNKYIIKRCIRPPVQNEERPHFVDFGKYHISYEHFRDSLKPRGRVAKHVMELWIRHFNLVCNTPTTSEPFCTKFAFSQSITSKLIVHEDVFDPKTCLKEFQKVYKDHELESKDMLYFAIVDGDHWILVSISLLHKQVNVLDSMRSAKKSQIYDKAHFLVNNFIALASFVDAFPKTDFRRFVENNPQELRQQITNFDCGIFVMLYMKHWDGKIMQDFIQDMFTNRMTIAHMLLTSELNKADPTWVLNWK